MARKSGDEKSHHNSIDEKVVHNLVELQKVHVTLVEKITKLSSQLENLLFLFESAAKSFASNPQLQVNDKDREFLDKIDKLLEQNKTIAKGLTLMDEKMREKIYGQNPSFSNRPPRF